MRISARLGGKVALTTTPATANNCGRRHHHSFKPPNSTYHSIVCTLTPSANSTLASTTAVAAAAAAAVELEGIIPVPPTSLSNSPPHSTIENGTHQLLQQELEGVLELTHGDDGNGPPRNNDDGSDGDGEPEPENNNDRSHWANPLTLLVCGVKGRLEADPFFAHKLLTEMGLDAVIILGVNMAARKERFLPELEFTMCQLAISLLSDFALVYLLAPSSMRAVARAGGLRSTLEKLPSHVFQASKAGAVPYTATQRISTFFVKSAQYGVVGYAMGCLGAASVQGLIQLREFLDPKFSSPATVQSTAGTGLAWCGFMASSSNVRYNMVNAAEDILYSRSVGMGKAGSFVLRLVNNWLGASHWLLVTKRLKLDRPWVSTKKKDVENQKTKRR